ncbi:hypothetical protein GCM10009619_15330 [Williamsia maris]
MIGVTQLTMALLRELRNTRTAIAHIEQSDVLSRCARRHIRDVHARRTDDATTPENDCPREVDDDQF